MQQTTDQSNQAGQRSGEGSQSVWDHLQRDIQQKRASEEDKNARSIAEQQRQPQQE
ncbi:MAG TPA: hypothetical protein VHL79_23045 [Ramlibacter sp.]|jgi:hypothetical protein|nr:hypothetical protein [Ramlibacter sp.]